MSFNGFSSQPRKQNVQTQTSPYDLRAIDDVIATMGVEGLGIYRMSFHPEFDGGTSFSNLVAFTQYYLDNCPHDLILDYYHMRPNAMSEANWVQSVERGVWLANYFDAYSDRLWLEPLNEQKFVSSFNAKIQGFIDRLRGPGYSHRVVANVFWEPHITSQAVIDDPLDRFWGGQHIYFTQGGARVWSLEQAKDLMQDALDRGIKVFNTEIGADSFGQQYFTEQNVGEVSEFMEWCSSHDIGNAVWVLDGVYDYPRYKKLGLVFPGGGPVAPPVEPPVEPPVVPPVVPPVAPIEYSDAYNMLSHSVFFMAGLALLKEEMDKN